MSRRAWLVVAIPPLVALSLVAVTCDRRQVRHLVDENLGVYARIEDGAWLIFGREAGGDRVPWEKQTLTVYDSPAQFRKYNSVNSKGIELPDVPIVCIRGGKDFDQVLAVYCVKTGRKLWP